MEHYLRYLSNIIANVISDPSSVQPVYGIALETRLHVKGTLIYLRYARHYYPTRAKWAIASSESLTTHFSSYY